MKKLFDFVYSPGTFSPQTIWYRVAVGTSQRDRAALARLRRVASQSPCILLAQHDAQLERVRGDIAAATFPAIPRPAAIMRVKHIGVQALARFVSSAPLALLNSSRIETPVSMPAMVLSGWRTPAAILQSRRRARRDTATPAHVINLE